MRLRPLQGRTPSGPPACQPAPGRLSHRQLPWSFSPLRRLSLGKSTNPGLPRRVRSALRVSHPLDGLLLAQTSDHFQAGNALGVYALQGLSPAARSRRLVAFARLPSWRLFLCALPRTSSVEALAARGALAQAFLRLQGLAPAADPCCPWNLFRPNGQPIPS
jgi:hypothetical protein